MLKIKEWISKGRPRWVDTWDAKGYEKNANWFGLEDEWNQTLLTKINQISAQMHMSTLLGGADTIEVDSSTFMIISTFEYFDPLTFKIGSRYDVIINKDMEKNTVSVYRKDIPNNLNNIDRSKLYGVIKILNRD